MSALAKRFVVIALSLVIAYLAYNFLSMIGQLVLLNWKDLIPENRELNYVHLIFSYIPILFRISHSNGILILFLGGAAVFMEMLRFRHLPYYLVLGLAFQIPGLLILADAGGMWVHTGEKFGVVLNYERAIVDLVSGLGAGFVYWLLAGRNAGIARVPV